METQYSLFGVSIPSVKEQVKRVRKQGTITISESTFKTNQEENKAEGIRKIVYGERGTSISFEGYQEGQSCMYTDEEIKDKSVDERVKELIEYYKKSTEYDYNIKVVDKRVKQQLVQEQKKPRITIKIKYDLDFDRQRKFFISDNRSDLGIETYLGGIDSSAYDKGTLEEKEEKALATYKEWLQKDGFEFDVIRVEMTKEELDFYNKKKAELDKNNLAIRDMAIERKSKELKDLLKEKYGYEVTIRVLKAENK